MEFLYGADEGADFWVCSPFGTSEAGVNVAVHGDHSKSLAEG